MSKVFVIDDSISVCVAIERMLGEQGFDVVWEKDAITALNTVEKHAPDLVICDLILPEIDGYEVCRSLRANPLLDNVLVVLISGSVNDEVRDRGREAGAAAIVSKPFTAEQLVGTVQEALESLKPTTVVPPSEPPTHPLRGQMAAKLEPLAVLGSRYACVLDPEHGILAGNGAAESRIRSLTTETELRHLGALASDVIEDQNPPSPGRLTLESPDGVRIIEGLGAGHHLIVALEDARVLGKTRFAMRRIRGSLARMLTA